MNEQLERTINALVEANRGLIRLAKEIELNQTVLDLIEDNENKMLDLRANFMLLCVRPELLEFMKPSKN